MLFTIAAVLLVLWLLGLVSGYTLGNFIYVLLVIALVLFRRRAVHRTSDNPLGSAAHFRRQPYEERAGSPPVLSVKEQDVAQTLAQFDTPVSDRYGRLYAAKACGRERDDRLWEGWIEFENEATGETLRTYRETTQPNLTDLQYWATGLTPVYLEGALDRILPKAPRAHARTESSAGLRWSCGAAGIRAESCP